MANYNQTTFFGPKDSLPLGNPSKLILGTDVDTELANIATAITSKYDASSIAASPIAFQAGTAALPAIYFGTANTTGLFQPAANQLGVSVSGTLRGTWSSTGLAITGILSTTGNATVGGALGVTGNSTLTGTLTVNGAGTGLTVANDASFGGNFNFLSGATGTFEYNGSGKLNIGANNAPQAVDDSGSFQVIGYRGIPNNSVTATYTAQLTDRGKMLKLTGATGTAVTIPANVFSAGDVLTLAAFSGSATYPVTQGTGLSLFWGNGSGGTSGSRTLASVGIATIIFTDATHAIITGSGLS